MTAGCRRRIMDRYMDAALPAKERAEDLLARMSVEEKVNQITCSSVMMIMPLEMQNLRGGIGAATIGLSVSSRIGDDVKKVQEHIMANSPHHIPALFHTEGLAGPICMLGANQYPVSIGLGASFEPEIVKKMASYTGRELAANGIRHALSPVSDLSRDLRWGRCNETYGNDPTLDAAMTVAFVQGMQGEDIKEGVAATCKHFLGYSASEGALNSFQTLLSSNQIREQYAKPFEAAINKAGLKTIMNSYSSVNGRPVTASKAILTDLLRGSLGFDGLVVADYGSVSQIRKPYCLAQTNEEAARLALEAGLDVEFPDKAVYGDELIKAVEEGRIDEALIDRAALRMLTLKFELGLFENPYGTGDYDQAMDLTEPNEGSLEAALKSMTLLKNDGILPVEDKKLKVAVIGPTAKSLRMMYSHYTAASKEEMVACIMKRKAEAEEQAKAAGMETAGLSAQDANFINILNQGRDESEAPAQPKSIEDKYFFNDTLKKAYPGAKTIYEALSERFSDIAFCEGCDYKGRDTSLMEEAKALAAGSDIVILAVGEKSGIDASCTSGEGVDSVSLGLPGMQDELVREVYAANSRCVLVHTGCRPLCDEWVYEHIPAVLEAWFPATYGGEAIAQVIAGECNPAGRTPVDLPRSAAHTPVYHSQYNGSSGDDREGMDGTGYMCSPSTSLRPFGYGLSYTTFAYSNGRINASKSGNIHICADVTNTGARDGEEVVQLYGKDLYASMVRPRQELVGFKRVALKAGETKTVQFDFNIDVLSFVDIKGRWIAESGDFEFFIGSSSKDKAVLLEYTLEKTRRVNPNKRTFYAEATVS